MTSQNQTVAMADALTLILNQQHGIAAAIEELAGWIASQGGHFAAGNALAALEGLDLHAKALTDAINTVRGG
ncbi:hypothetical protein DMX03_06050 [Pseudomonas koreensis]|uniref:hypothetical protein n=1 Tax=Pseudomonas moraviensis TaxID=321662 RepID=UPI000935B1B5|nr:hypothetical protein [Pseudomonas moraviensis]OJT50902.1 hypothetical protein BSZ28_13705 [Pseudomonas moraviensis]PYB89969.1 hypothetical protein DMX03_06050 [Pseudomonas koreensis]